MGKGPKNAPASEPSRKPRLTARLQGGADAPPAIDPCTRRQEVTIAMGGAPAVVGDAIWIVAAAPPQAVSPAGVVGPLTGEAAKRVEACLRGGYTFDGVIASIAGNTATAVVEGR